jgi:hypothetical protein
MTEKARFSIRSIHTSKNIIWNDFQSVLTSRKGRNIQTRHGSIPFALEEAGQVDGETPWQKFYHVVLPMMRPGLLTVAIIVGLNARQLLKSSRAVRLPSKPFGRRAASGVKNGSRP